MPFARWSTVLSSMTIQLKVLTIHAFTSLLYMLQRINISSRSKAPKTQPVEHCSPPSKPVNFLVITNRYATSAPAKTFLVQVPLQKFPFLYIFNYLKQLPAILELCSICVNNFLVSEIDVITYIAININQFICFIFAKSLKSF